MVAVKIDDFLVVALDKSEMEQFNSMLQSK